MDFANFLSQFLFGVTKKLDKKWKNVKRKNGFPFILLDVWMIKCMYVRKSLSYVDVLRNEYVSATKYVSET